MKTSLTVLTTIAVVLSASPWKAHSAEENFEKRKAEAIAKIDERIQKLQEHKGCLSSASNADAIKKCNASMKDWRHKQKLDRMEKRKGRMDERMKKLQEKKKAN